MQRDPHTLTHRDRRLFVIDTATGNIVSKGVLDPHHYSKTVTASAFAQSSGDLYTFATALTSELIIWTLDPFTGLLSPRAVTAGSVRRTYTCLVFSPDSQWLYAGTTSGDVVTINVLRAAAQLVHPACSNGVGAMVLSSTGRLLVGGGDGGITLFSNDHMWRDVRPFVTVPGSITSLSAAPDGAYLVVGTADGSVWRVVSGSLQVSPISQGPGGACMALAVPTGAAPSTLMATAAADGRLLAYDVQSQALLQSVGAEPSAGVPLCIAIAGQQLVSGWEDGAIRGHMLQADGMQRAAVGTSRAAASPLAWSLPGAHALAHSCGVTALQVAPRSQVLTSGGSGGEIRVWGLGGRRMLSHLKGHAARVNQLAFLQDEAHLLAASDDHTLSAWDINVQKNRAVWRRSVAVRGVAVGTDQVRCWYIHVF
jgi:WD40 repeat protein